ncbi:MULTISPECIES: bifunctional diguanylate cyclase/phosphodiesterase [Exiguobacterium]|uniref:bifunctional diguanylate cyclase/phosphodiesterase n=1 Tax=Exiguobacterium TaxID=33986 RepID=UPI001BE8F41A|nr:MULTISPECIES: EAL domain-containing protein [Exiguobacterium]MCT4781680.1 EAL domain-containing protein [Exiguobacterium himgiriensis]
MTEGNFSAQSYRRHQEKLFDLVRMPDVNEATVHQAIAYMCQVVSDMLDVDTVSIWHFDDTYASIRCQVAYSKEVGQSYPDLIVYRDDAPVYFDALRTNRVLPFDDVRSHEWVKGLYQQYFVEGQRIYSMLDAPIYANNKAKGVICCETFAPRQWTYMEELMVSTLSDFISILYLRLERHSIEEHITRLAYTDELTGLMNENAFVERIDEVRKQSSDRLGSLIYLKVDKFRAVEDALGLEKSDTLVKEVADRLRQHVDRAMLARISQSGFMVWTPYGDRIKAYGIADLLAETVTREAYKVGELDVVLTMSAFIAIEDKTYSTLELIHATRLAESGNVQRGVVSFYEPEMGEKAAAALKLEMNLRKGIALNEFTLFYQPKIDAATGQLNGFEGLMRWVHPEKGLIPPLDFIPLAESTGIIIALEEQMLAIACKQLKAWHDAGRTYRLALNLSARHFLSDGVVEKLTKIVKEIGVCPNYLTFEITESVGMENQQHVIERFVDFRNVGFSISIDDFGTGFSAFVYLKHYPIQEIKIDRQFIQATESDPTGNVIVQSIIELAKGLKLRTVCEGIETESQRETLKALGCDEMQGYLFSRPLPIEELETWIEAYETT